MIEKFSTDGSFIVGVVADTHIPDRTRLLNPKLIQALEEHKVNLILHAGDICVPRVLDELREAAPVLAVKGNRDILFGKDLPISRILEINGIKILLTHGHMGLTTYWLDKFQHLVIGYRLNRYTRRLKKEMPGARVYIFGHSHRSEIIWKDDVLFFNPGSVSIGSPPHFHRSWGLLTFTGKTFEGTIIPLV
jgi:hypothetical protein